ncbi:MAG: nucleotidyltransferase family protein [Actinomycetota bacterium]|nr:nucleotidyltransferase family protein [Actinomycetota bacterium]
MSDDAKDQEKASAVFRATIDLFERLEIDYAVGGGLATDHWTGGATRIGDIDLVIREEDASRILHELADDGYDVTEMEHSWLHKAFKDGVTIDLMHELKNGTTFDARFKDHRRKGEMFGTTTYVMAPEDQVASLAGAIDRETIGDHWFNMIDIMSNNDLEWDYLISRAQRIPQKMLSVVYFALSERVPVKKGVIEQLAELSAAAEH